MHKGFAIIFALLSFFSKGQNLVLNGNFELYTQCPYMYTNIDDALYVHQPSDGSSDYLNSCGGPTSWMYIPDNIFGSQYAQCGEGYGQIITYQDNGEYREYIEFELSQPLTPGFQYKVGFYISRGEFSTCATNGFGAAFCIGHYYEPTQSAIQLAPEYYETAVIGSTTDWGLITFDFMATQPYDRMIVGSFLNNSQVNMVVTDLSATHTLAFYYLDNVSLTALPEAPDTICKGDSITLNSAGNIPVVWSTGDTAVTITVSPDTTTIYTYIFGECYNTIDTIIVNVSTCYYPLFIPNVFTPSVIDGFNDTFAIENLPENSSLIIYNRWGVTVYQSDDYQNNWDGKEHSQGVYYYILTTSNGKKYSGTVTLL